MSAGPFMFKEWVTDEKIVLERNPDFVWGPAGTRGGPPFIQNIEFRIIPEHATVLAGLEAGEIDYAGLEIRDIERVEGTGEFEIFSALRRGIGPVVIMNVSRSPLDDVLVRQALNLAVNKDALIKVVALGHAIPQYGPISQSVQGYWEGVEYIGYDYDPDKAKALLEEAGYSLGGDGVWEKDGQRLSLLLKVPSDSATHTKVAPIVQENFKDIGVELELELQEFGVLDAQFSKGDYELGILNWTYSNSGLMYAMFHSSMIGALNPTYVNNPELDEILSTMGFTTDAEVSQNAAAEAQRFIVEQAYLIPTYTAEIPRALNKRVKGARFSPIGGVMELYDAYIEMAPQ
jgi:peptide/nickel transport system substrate-binding protein